MRGDGLMPQGPALPEAIGFLRGSFDVNSARCAVARITVNPAPRVWMRWSSAWADRAIVAASFAIAWRSLVKLKFSALPS